MVAIKEGIYTQLLGTGKQRAGKTSRISVGTGAQFLTFASWEAGLEQEDYPTTNFESYNVVDAESYDEGIGGVLGSTIRFGGDWDAGTNPQDNPPGLYPRDDLAQVKFYTSRLDNVLWNFLYVRLRGATNGTEIRGKVAFNVNGRSQGRFIKPTGSV